MFSGYNNRCLINSTNKPIQAAKLQKIYCDQLSKKWKIINRLF